MLEKIGKLTSPFSAIQNQFSWMTSRSNTKGKLFFSHNVWLIWETLPEIEGDCMGGEGLLKKVLGNVMFYSHVC